MPSDPDPIHNLRRLAELRKEASEGPWDGSEDWLSCADGPLCYPDCLREDDAAFIAAAGNLDFPALLATIDRLQRIEAAAKSLTNAWQRGDHEQAIIDAVAKLTKEVQP